MVAPARIQVQCLFFHTDEVERRQEASSEQNAGPSSHEEVHVPSIDRDEIRLGAHEGSSVNEKTMLGVNSFSPN